MRVKTTSIPAHESDQLLALDWGSLGRLVRGCTLDALTLHFLGLADPLGQLGPDGRSTNGCDRSEQ